MRRYISLLALMISSVHLLGQNPSTVQTGSTLGARHLSEFTKISTYDGYAVGFDTRYEGVKGTPRLFDTLLPSSVLVKGADYFIAIDCDLDLASNYLLFYDPDEKIIKFISSDNISQVIIRQGDKQMIFRTTDELEFKKRLEGNRFYQMLVNGPDFFIRIPEKRFVKADYNRIYGPDIRYDEFKLVNWYYLAGPDSLFTRITLNSKSLIKQFPEKRALIMSQPEPGSEDDVISIMGKFQQQQPQ